MDQLSSEKLARLWTEAQPVVGSYILSLLPDFHQAEDVLQQVAVLLVREFEKYDASRPFLPWALGIARNMVLKSRREAARNSKHFIGEAMMDQIQAAFEEQPDAWGSMRKALRRCLGEQPPKMLELLRWRYAFDLKPAEVARRMGITGGAARVMLHRARLVLRQCIKRYAEGGGQWA
jgi:RNA polymerase sigma-70 factor (ECF subfamily)